ncbi:hypothetical protein [Acinetobacter venetianus]|uniref:hypothetical protein n=1 Tax=Acinetobacter venetianus TaxID=52133 RepID=UPI00214FDD5F|nr:hypothetical protein [Acinetobacter venetianus]MCR4532486.1 hypothetical protein [Acinetobacter venetianus]
MSCIKKDRELIKKRGGVTVLANSLGYNVQRVQNWTVRGIPAKEKLEHPELLWEGYIAQKN